MQIYLTRSVSGLAAADDEAVACLRKIKLGQVVRADVVTPRNLKHHRKFFALLNLVWAATDQWESVVVAIPALRRNPHRRFKRQPRNAHQ